MRESVRQAFVPFTIPLEGARPDHVGVPWMYQDVKGLVSSGLGHLLDPIGLALSLPFLHADGRRATREEIAAEWHRIKNQPPDAKGRTAAQLGHLYAKRIATLHLTNDAIKVMIAQKLAIHETMIAEDFPEWEEWPADAQLATHSMAWACGGAIFRKSSGRAHWPKLTAALKARDFRTAAVECFMNEEAENPGIIPRNKANRILYTNAAIALHKLDPDTLFYPTDLSKPAPTDTPTTPVLVPEVRPDPLGHVEIADDFHKVRGPVPFGRPELDGDLPTTTEAVNDDESS